MVERASQGSPPASSTRQAKGRSVVRITEPISGSRAERFGRAHRQRECFEFIEAVGGSCELSELRRSGGFSAAVISGLEKKGLVLVESPPHASHVEGETTDAKRKARNAEALRFGPRIMVVEDDEEGWLLLSNALHRITSHVRLAASLAEAWRLLDEETFDAVILDLVLPDGDGRRILGQLRAWEPTAGVPVLVLSGRDTRETKLDCFRLGADDFFEKPVDPEVLCAAVQRRIERAAASHTLSHLDPLTGLPDQAGLARHFGKAAALADELDQPLSLAYVEIDGFDTDHDLPLPSVQESTIESFARNLERSLRATDIVGRWRDHGFLVLLPRTDISRARKVLENASEPAEQRRGLGTSSPTAIDPGPIPPFSAGVVDARRHQHLEDVVQAAQRYLEEARHAGSGRIALEGRESAPTSHAIRVLLVDDDQGIATLVRHRLERDGLELEHLDNGDDALTLLADPAAMSTFDLIVLDMKLPGAGGFELLGRLREQRQSRRVPVIMLTSIGREADIVRAFESGADDYVLKPFSPIELLARIHRLVRPA